MRSDLDEQALYPPDADAAEVTADEKQHRNRVAIGAALLVWGTSLLVQRSLGLDLDTLLLGVGVGALAGWCQVRRYGWFVVGAVATAAGLGDLLPLPIGAAFSTALSNLLVGAGFAAVYVRYPRRSGWALAVGAVFALIGVVAFGVGIVGLVPVVLGRFLLPLLLIGGGALLLARHSLPPKTVKIGLAALAVAFVAVGSSNVSNVDHRPPWTGPSGALALGAQPLGDLEGRTLVLDGGSGDVRFERSDDGLAWIRPTSGDGGLRHRGPGGMAPLTVQHEGSRVSVRSGDRPGFFGGPAEADYLVQLPEGVDVEVVRGSGDVSGVVAGGRWSVRTTSGDVDLEVVDAGVEGAADDGPVDVETESGSVHIGAKVVLDLDLAGDGDVVVADQARDGRFRSPAGTGGIEVEVDTRSGDIVVDAPVAASPAPAPSTSVPAPADPAASGPGD